METSLKRQTSQKKHEILNRSISLSYSKMPTLQPPEKPIFQSSPLRASSSINSMRETIGEDDASVQPMSLAKSLHLTPPGGNEHKKEGGPTNSMSLLRSLNENKFVRPNSYYGVKA